MLLNDHLSSVDLRPLRYQFPAVRGDAYDDNWLVVGGKVTTPRGSWSFTEPCLLVDEARRVTAWLRAAAEGTVPATGPDDEGELSPDAWFIEPVLGFSVAGRDENGTTVRVHLSAEAAPPWRHDDEDTDIHQYAVEVRMSPAALLHAADRWDLALAPFPGR